MSSAKPTREQADLADVLELILDKGIVINADIAITVGETELIGIELRAAIASFETAAEYGLAFPSGTDMQRVEQASGREPLDEENEIDLGIRASEGGESGTTHDPPPGRPDPSIPFIEGEKDEEKHGETEERNEENEGSDSEESGEGNDAEATGDTEEPNESEPETS